MCKLMDIEIWCSHQCLDFLWAERSHGRLCGRAPALYRLPTAARASFIFTFLRAFLCSSTRAPEARASRRLRLRVRSSLWKEPPAQAGARSSGTAAQGTRGWRWKLLRAAAGAEDELLLRAPGTSCC
ncbi:hypothetical protein DV515_00007008 [Chloebia gouldiae]|uniref:Uncharacterized protein n=1 Tax=Chloebia gouldiae TaxID=44316 RepID=A0A3L8SJ11_CHLGU|nr:hypothetical protein DV515_00007008 [Chloebia gouldiae]